MKRDFHSVATALLSRHRKILLLLTLLVVSADCYCAGTVDLWSVREGSPKVAKITITRKYEQDTREEHQHQRVLAAWWATDGACLAWASEHIYESRYYSSKDWHTNVIRDTVQANYSEDIILLPNITNEFTKDFSSEHYTKDKDRRDKYGNWIKAYKSGDGTEYVEREIEYAGSVSEETAAEIAHFQNIRTSGIQTEKDYMSKSEFKSLISKRRQETIQKISGPIKIILMLVFGLYPLMKYRKWKKESFLSSGYNTYGAGIWLCSAMAMFFTSGLYVIALPLLNKMLIYDKRFGYGGTTGLMMLNLITACIAMGQASIAYLWYFGPLLVFIGLCVFSSFLFFEQAYKCPHCHNVHTTHKETTAGGIMEEHSHNHSDDHSVQGDILVKTHTYTHRTDYYQKDVHLFYCRTCGHRWSRTMKGRYLGSSTKREIDEERFGPR